MIARPGFTTPLSQVRPTSVSLGAEQPDANTAWDAKADSHVSGVAVSDLIAFEQVTPVSVAQMVACIFPFTRPSDNAARVLASPAASGAAVTGTPRPAELTAALLVAGHAARDAFASYAAAASAMPRAPAWQAAAAKGNFDIWLVSRSELALFPGARETFAVSPRQDRLVVCAETFLSDDGGVSAAARKDLFAAFVHRTPIAGAQALEAAIAIAWQDLTPRIQSLIDKLLVEIADEARRQHSREDAPPGTSIVFSMFDVVNPIRAQVQERRGHARSAASDAAIDRLVALHNTIVEDMRRRAPEPADG